MIVACRKNKSILTDFNFYKNTFVEGKCYMTSAGGLLDAIIQSLNEKMGDIVVSTFFRSARALALKDDTLVIAVPTILERDGLCERFTDNVCDIFLYVACKIHSADHFHNSRSNIKRYVRAVRLRRTRFKKQRFIRKIFHHVF